MDHYMNLDYIYSSIFFKRQDETKHLKFTIMLFMVLRWLKDFIVETIVYIKEN